MPYRIDRRGAMHAVVGTNAVGDTIDEEYGTRDEAVKRIQELGGKDAAWQKAEKENAASDPQVQERRRIKAAYRLAERDSVLRAIKTVFPKKGQAERNTQRSYEEMLKWIGAHASVASSNPVRDKMLKYTPKQRQTAAAAQAKRQQGESTYLRALDLKKQGKSNADIAQELGVSDRHIRKLLNSK